MRSIAEVFQRIPEPRVILLIQDSKACWYKVINGEVVDIFVEFITDYSDYCRIPPFQSEGKEQSNPQYVELVLDTTLDEVDRISVEKTGFSLVDGYRKIATLANLRKDYPHADVYSLPGGYQQQVAAVMHPAHPACWDPWLLHLQSHNVVFHKVWTGAELVACWAQRFTTRVLLVMQAGSYQRHLLVDGGSMVFLRTITVESSTSSVKMFACSLTGAAVEQSMAYLASAVHLDTDGVLVANVCVNRKQSAGDTTATSGRHALDDTLGITAEHAATPLVLMLLGKPVLHECGIWRDGQLIPTAAEHGSRTSTTGKGSGERSRYDTLFESLFKRSKSLDAPLSARLLLHSATRWIDALSPSVNYQRTSKKIAIMLNVSVALVLMVSVIFSVSMAHGISGARERHKLRAQIRTIEESTVSMQAKIKSQYKAPWASADSLFFLDQLASLHSFEPQQLLSEIATAVTSVPGVQLDNMAWAIVDRDDAYTNLSYGLASVGHRQSFDILSQNSILQLEISGRSTGKSLMDRKQHLDDFVSELKSLSGVMDVQVYESPADSALSSNVDEKNPDAFRLSLKLDEI